ncbi:hypothetical protein BCR34DRAFT_358071 [Clohesyomyces aquaticus]|uniref:Ketoreductase domain-containing protein n=1 Tax=Clohesyomyces aquaticus TaxID=1231657 RepID=A0A1Y1ZIJ9_9PLEO|nr:hypothetical protein BCR34DRAFT_358071 [Clohesyomyces aquaticus]
MPPSMSFPAFLALVLCSQLFRSIPTPTISFANQTVIVTGSNTGLGLEAARHLVRLGAAKVILAVRTVSKGYAAAEELLASTKATKDVIEVWQLDLSDYASVKAFAKRVEGLQRLDAVIQNAGIMTLQFKKVEAMESIIAVNVVGAVLLGLLLLPKLRETAERFGTRTRLSFVGSDMQYVAQCREAQGEGSAFEKLNEEKGAAMDDRYATSKLLLLYAVRSIALLSSPQSGSKSSVLINCMTPGLCKSSLFRDDLSFILRTLQGFMMTLLARSTEVGGRALVDAVRPDLGEETHGAFLMDCRVADNGTSVDSVEGKKLQERFTKELFERLEEISPGVTSVLH